MTHVEELGAKHPESLPILEFWAAMYSELNRESQYFETLIRLFDANFNSGSFDRAVRFLTAWWISTLTTIETNSAWKS